MTASGFVDEKATRSCYRAHGVELICDFPILAEVSTFDPGATSHAINVAAQSRGTVESLWSGDVDGPVHQTVLSDGKALVVEEGEAGDHLIHYGEALFHLTSGLDVISCTPPTDADTGWQRALLDWVTYIASVLAGMDAIHASAVKVPSGVLAFAATSGGGKTSLATEFVSTGAEFFCDDVLTFRERDGQVLAYPGAPFLNLDRSRRRLVEQVGTPLATFGDEIWLSPDRRATGPAPVLAVIVLDRRQDGPESAEFTAESFVTLRNLVVGLPHLRGREQQRFAILATLAEQAPMLRLRANSAVSAHALMRSIEVHLACQGTG